MKTWLTVVGTAITALLAVGCGPYEPEPEYPQYQYVAPPPPTAEELAAQQQARAAAAQENREIVVGDDGDEYSDTDPGALTEFKPTLEGHGTWVEDATYGTVWVPASAEVGTDFQPYVTAGHWTYSDDSDYVWVSDYSWGWAPFHYGRWVFLPGHGWSWIPGRRYAGAWVVWRTGPVGYGYVGWAPMAPSWYWWHGAAIGWSFGWYHHHDYYVYCAHDRFYQPAVSTHVVRGPAAREHYGRTADYQPAAPSVGGRVVANPTVAGGRVVANPTVSGPDGRVAATPKVGGQSAVRGPRPDELGMRNDLIVAPPRDNGGLNRAQAFATPKSAVAAGGAAPAHARPYPSVGASRAPASSSMIGPQVDGRSATVAAPPPQPSDLGRGYSARVPRYSAPSTSLSTPRYASPSPSFGPPAPSSPSFRSSTPTYRASPSFTSPSSPSFRSSTPTYRASPSFTSPSSPSFRSSTPTYRASPSFRSSSPSSPSFRSSTPTFRSTPSVRSSSPSTYRSSSPTVHSAPSRPSVRAYRRR